MNKIQSGPEFNSMILFCVVYIYCIIFSRGGGGGGCHISTTVTQSTTSEKIADRILPKSLWKINLQLFKLWNKNEQIFEAQELKISSTQPSLKPLSKNSISNVLKLINIKI